MKLKFIFGIVGYTLLGLSTSISLNEPASAGSTPRTCASLKSPTKGAPTIAQAEAYFICGAERSSNRVRDYRVRLVRNVQMEMSPKPIFVNAANASNVRDTISDSYITVDVEKPMYAIRGSFANYSCNGGNNSPTCLESIIVEAKGFCFVDTFSDWHCIMKGKLGRDTRHNVPLPAGS